MLTTCLLSTYGAIIVSVYVPNGLSLVQIGDKQARDRSQISAFGSKKMPFSVKIAPNRADAEVEKMEY